MKSALRLTVIALLVAIGHVVSQLESTDDTLKYRSLFVRVPDSRIASVAVKNVTGSDIESCARSCIQEIHFDCRSFDFVNVNHECRLHIRAHERTHVDLHIGTDHYKSAFEKLFSRIPNQVVTLRHNRKVAGLTVEECARHCYLERQFTCRGFDYDEKSWVCWMTEHTPQSSGGVQLHSTYLHYYELKPEGVLRNFVNYGFGALRNVITSNVYSAIRRNVTLETCAQLCLEQTGFHCWSFDYNFTATTCMLSSKIAANVYGVQLNHADGVRIMHYERKGEHLSFFYATPYLLIDGYNEMVYKRVTPEMCARYCLRESSFVCRSFDYQIEEGVCLLSPVTGSDVGNLMIYSSLHTQIHHFEMKPLLDCGGNLTSDYGDIASPNWPRDYAPYENCVWNIEVSPFKVIHFNFVHLDLGREFDATCDSDNDRLLLKETTGGVTTEKCVAFRAEHLITKTNSVTLTFTSNGVKDAPGFRAFYVAEWPCVATLREDNGQLATEYWPRQRYPAGSECSWLIQAPNGHSIVLAFTQFHFDNDSEQNCEGSGRDHVTIRDGDSRDSDVISVYCGAANTTVIESTSDALRVSLTSTIVGASDDRKGFHARYWFKVKPTTTTEVVTTTEAAAATTTEVAMTTTTTIADIITTVKDTVYNTTSSLSTDGAEASSSPDNHSDIEQTTRDSSLWVVCVVIVVVALLCAVGLFIFCKYRRKRMTKPSQRKTQTITAESSALCDEELSSIETQAQAPPINITSFANPLYSSTGKKRNSKKAKVAVTPMNPS